MHSDEMSLKDQAKKDAHILKQAQEIHKDLDRLRLAVDSLDDEKEVIEDLDDLKKKIAKRLKEGDEPEDRTEKKEKSYDGKTNSRLSEEERYRKE